MRYNYRHPQEHRAAAPGFADLLMPAISVVMATYNRADRLRDVPRRPGPPNLSVGRVRSDRRRRRLDRRTRPHSSRAIGHATAWQADPPEQRRAARGPSTAASHRRTGQFVSSSTTTSSLGPDLVQRAPGAHDGRSRGVLADRPARPLPFPAACAAGIARAFAAGWRRHYERLDDGHHQADRRGLLQRYTLLSARDVPVPRGFATDLRARVRRRARCFGSQAPASSSSTSTRAAA